MSSLAHGISTSMPSMMAPLRWTETLVWGDSYLPLNAGAKTGWAGPLATSRYCFFLYFSFFFWGFSGFLVFGGFFLVFAALVC
jgi:hypothetical protein